MDMQDLVPKKRSRHSRFHTILLLFLATLLGMYIQEKQPLPDAAASTPEDSAVIQQANENEAQKYSTALEALDSLAVKGRAAKTGYRRSLFGDGWQKTGSCDTRNRVLARDLSSIVYAPNSCVVLSGVLNDPYTGRTIPFIRGKDTSDDVQIDHVVALSDAWQKGAQLLTQQLRQQLANDGLNLLAVDGNANQNKGDGDAATWLPRNKDIRCAYIARQISVKLKYSLWVTSAEKNAMKDILKGCPNQPYAK